MTSFTLPTCLILSASLLCSTICYAADNAPLQTAHPLKSLLPPPTDPVALAALKDVSTKIALAKTNKVTQQTTVTYGGGYGGNEQTSILRYDGLPYHLSAFPIWRDDKNKTCYMENQDAGVYHYNFLGGLKLAHYACPSASKSLNGVYWNERLDIRNGGYSTDNDALYANFMINQMYKQWFGIAPTQNIDGEPTPLKMVTHIAKLEEAYAEDGRIILGDGAKNDYPYTSPGIISFITGYIFTEQHSNLDYNQATAAGISVAFNAMADQAIKFYISGQNDWQVGTEITKTGQPFYYIDQPTKDCGSRKPGDNCSIDHMSQFKSDISPHYISGIYRRAIYLLATTPDWDVKKAFSIMVQANRFYWTRKTSLTQGLCGLIKASRDLQYNENAVIDAFSQVGISSQNC